MPVESTKVEVESFVQDESAQVESDLEVDEVSAQEAANTTIAKIKINFFI